MAAEQNNPADLPNHSSAQPAGGDAIDTNENKSPQPETGFQNIQNEEGSQPSAIIQAAELAGLHPTIKEMELHHAQAPHKKKLKDYLFEFFMLFLAISLGFFVIKESILQKAEGKSNSYNRWWKTCEWIRARSIL